MNKYITVILLSTAAILILFLNSSKQSNELKEEKWLEQFNLFKIMDTRYLVTRDSKIIYSENTGHHFSLKKYENGIVHDQLSCQDDIFSPFCYKNEIMGLTDQMGDENYCLSPGRLSEIIRGQNIEFIKSSINGNCIVYKYKDDSRIYLLLTETNSIKCIGNVHSKYHAACFSKEEDKIALSYDSSLTVYNIKNNTFTTLAGNIQAEKLNPYIFNESVYFASDYNLEYYGIYVCKMGSGKCMAQLVLSKNHDLRMPKYNGNYLYYLEVCRSEYLLRKINLAENKVVNLTNKGVLYNYEIFDNGEVVILYSDYYNPVCLMRYDEYINDWTNMTGESKKLSSNYQYIEESEELSSAYQYLPDKNADIKGVILFFHPGLNNDFSPRWDPILSTLTEMGYIIISPNYPMSCGYGKKYKNKDLSEAIEDINKWKEVILNNYSGYPLYYMSSSSGNILMEECLNIDDRQVKACISLFGLSENYYIPNIPSCYILGRNDPHVSYAAREMFLKDSKKKNMTILDYEGEGHWFRKIENIKNCLIHVRKFMYEENSGNRF